MYHPHRPAFSIPSLRIHRLNLTTSADSATSHLSTLLNLTIISKNPNSHFTFFYDSFTISSFSNDVFLGNGTLPAYSLSKKNETSFRNVVISGSNDLDTDSVNALRSDLKKKSGGVTLKIQLDTKAKVQMGGLKTKKVGIRVTCEGIKGTVPKGKSPTVAVTTSSKCEVTHLLTLRLEANSFAGTIDFVNPLSSSILEFNVSNNHLSGKIPAWLTRFPASSFSGNDHLCGEPLRSECSNQTVRSQPVQSSSSVTEKKRSKWVVFMIVGIDTAAIVAAIATITCCCYYRRIRNSGNHGEVIERKDGLHPQIGGYYYGGAGGRREGEEMVVFEGCKSFNGVDDLLKSSAELLGKGSIGATYKVEMNGGDVLVVKRVKERRRKREVSGWLRVIGGLRHGNIASLRAYYNSKDEMLLVYDYLPNGSLQSLLHGNRGPGRTPLDWATRLKIASGSVKGLAFLHGYNKAKLFHGNLTSSNILVDQFGNACISEICLRQLLHSPSPLSNNSYKAPELMPNNNNSVGHGNGKFTQKCDVYSFGVILLEILTGKMPNCEGEKSLVRWVQRVWREEWTWEVFDFELYRCKEMEEEMMALMQVALLCLAPLPRDRPKMSMVHRMIEDIRTKGARQGGIGSPNSILNDLSSDSSPSVSENTINFISSS
ncbi:hypothetical protein GH714_030200 [Hevea brasiliensis]|uniref:Protein kinase domain-containing protein n=1 Tax=Hevea brasiliensis TaxID=3981 RepID=A0A6A6LVQ4_HEVBR|nr:hypothetical protein GH714_030200 [Hevea brasiliensis]